MLPLPGAPSLGIYLANLALIDVFSLCRTAMHEWIDTLSDTPAEKIRESLTAALLSDTPRIAPRYLYDQLGSALFSAITCLPEYYPSRLEHEILDAHGAAIAQSLSQARTLVELGAGDGKKAASLLGRMTLAHYVAVDISKECLRQTVNFLSHRFPQLRVTGLVSDFSNGLVWPSSLDQGRLLFFYPGSSLGNFSPEEAEYFLRSLSHICQRSQAGSGDLLIGIDLQKPRAVMEAAYDDALGVTACFNRNVLLHLNRLLSANFDLARFRHRAIFNAEASRIEMSLECVAAQHVSWQGGSRHFKEGDQLSTEHSYKYTPERFASLLKASGFSLQRQWLDASGAYLLCQASSDRNEPQ